MIAFLCVCAAFALGFFLRGNAAFLEHMGFSMGDVDEQENPGLTVSGSTYDSVSARVAEVQGILEEYSLDSYDLDSATEEAVSALVDATDDSYVHYYDAAHYAAYMKEDSSVQYAGIGALISEYEGQAYVVEVFPGSEAEAKGVQAGDFIEAIDGDRGEDGWPQAAAVHAIGRDEGETVLLTLRRPYSFTLPGGTEYTVTIECKRYSEPNVTTSMQGDTVGYISVSQFSQNASSLISEAVSSLATQGATSFVLDLRGCPGGYLTQALDTASLFVKSGVLVQIQTKGAVTTKSASGETVTDAPLVVLVNEDTSGVAEVLAAALQDTDRATLVGATTMGKGTVQSIRELSFGGALRYTSAKYLTPLGYEIDGEGVTPQVEIASSDDSDSQLSYAVDTAAALAG